MAKHDPRYSTRKWQAIRRAVLDRDGWRCMADHQGCKYKEPGSLRKKNKGHVHHIWPPVDGGPFWDWSNLQAVCASYNIAERNQRVNAKTLEPTTTYPEHW